MSPIRMYRAMTCNTRVRVALSSTAVLFSTVGAAAQALTIERQPASAWDSPLVWFSAGGFLLSAAGILIGAGSLIQTVKAFSKQLGEEQKSREDFEHEAREQFARKDVLAVQFAAISNELALLRKAILPERVEGGRHDDAREG